MGVEYCEDGTHEWGQFEDGTFKDMLGYIIEECTKCGYLTEWLLK